ncbi:Opsin-5 [Lonchura striata]|uniref:Opsin-5 n=1 Tax=Lonchura striata TaxID=40157 RepID=A0A218UGP1_9PASE|nr:Opsin-5 [Lonchura striata domestica]
MLLAPFLALSHTAAFSASCTGIVSLSGNSLLLLVAHQKRSLLKPAEFFIVNLAISDLSMTVTLFPPGHLLLLCTQVLARVQPTELPTCAQLCCRNGSSCWESVQPRGRTGSPAASPCRWLFGQAVCSLYAFCGVLFELCSLGSLTVLSTLCCLKVCFPAYARCWDAERALAEPRRRAAAGRVGPRPGLAARPYGPAPYGPACCIAWRAAGTEAALYILALLVFCYLLPCLLVLASYALILRTVWGYGNRAAAQGKTGMVIRNGKQSYCSGSRRLSTFPWGYEGPCSGSCCMWLGLGGVSVPRVLQEAHGAAISSAPLQLSVAVCLGFLAAWTPYAVLALWALLGDASQVPALALVLSAVFAKSSTLYNPLVYLLLKPSFHRFLPGAGVPLRALLCCGCRGAALGPLPVSESPSAGGV